jgi:hypothetical protein
MIEAFIGVANSNGMVTAPLNGLGYAGSMLVVSGIMFSATSEAR